MDEQILIYRNVPDIPTVNEKYASSVLPIIHDEEELI
jgi:hypothetical protein